MTQTHIIRTHESNMLKASAMYVNLAIRLCSGTFKASDWTLGKKEGKLNYFNGCLSIGVKFSIYISQKHMCMQHKQISHTTRTQGPEAFDWNQHYTYITEIVGLGISYKFSFMLKFEQLLPEPEEDDELFPGSVHLLHHNRIIKILF